MSSYMHFEEPALKSILRRKPVSDQMAKVGRNIVLAVETMAPRTGDNRPRHIRKTALNAGYGYTHYEDSLYVLRGMDNGMAAVYVIVPRLNVLLEYGWTDSSGRRHPGRKYVSRALSQQRS